MSLSARYAHIRSLMSAPDYAKANAARVQEYIDRGNAEYVLSCPECNVPQSVFVLPACIKCHEVRCFLCMHIERQPRVYRHNDAWFLYEEPEIEICGVCISQRRTLVFSVAEHR